MKINPQKLPRRFRKAIAAASAVAVLGFIGCGKPAATEPKHADDAHDHAHAAEGPHGGHILEFGTEDHHAELTHDEDTHRIGVYFLGSDAKTIKPIDATSVTINVAIDGQPYQYELPATDRPGEETAKGSYFEVTSQPLCDLICGELEVAKARAELRVDIGGVPHTAAIEIEPHGHEHK
jgi:hypothetical protein